MSYSDYRKKDKTGPLGLSQEKARNLATGIGQSCDAAMMTGRSRSMRVADCIPPKQKAALVKNSGYPPVGEAMYGLIPTPAAERTAKQTRVDGKVL